MLAYGRECCEVGPQDHVVWASPDGVEWERDSLSLPDDLAEIYQLVVTDDRLWAMGMSSKVAGRDRVPVLLSSSDGRTWVASDAGWVGPLHALDGVLHAIVQPEPTTGPESTPPPAPPAKPEPGLYRLDASGTWERLSRGLAAFADDVISVDGTLIMVGSASSTCGMRCHATGWRSTDDGVTWESVLSDDLGGSMTAVAALPDGTLIAVGFAQNDPAITTTAAWVSPPDGR